MHVNPLPIASRAIHVHRDNNKLFLCDKIPYASLVLGCLVRLDGVEIEFQGRG